jgi:hypothetical protein
MILVYFDINGLNSGEFKYERAAWEANNSDSDFGHHLSICFKGEDLPPTKRKSVSRWLVAGPAAATGPSQLGPQTEQGLNTWQDTMYTGCCAVKQAERQCQLKLKILHHLVHYASRITCLINTGNKARASLRETSRLPHFVDNRLTDGGEVVSLTHRPAALYPQEDSWYSFLLEGEPTSGPQWGWKD